MRRFNTILFLSLLCTAFAVTALAQDKPWNAPARAAAKKNPIPANAAAIEAGKKVFEKECLSCHGPNGKGDGPKAAQIKTPPRDLSSAQVTAQSDGALYWKLNEGRNPMPKFDELLTDDQRWQVIDYLRTFAAPAAANPSADSTK